MNGMWGGGLQTPANAPAADAPADRLPAAAGRHTMVLRLLITLFIGLLLPTAAARADLRRIDLKIFGMD